jgi:hypothetical protein
MTPLPTDTALPRLLRCVGERPMTELGAHLDVHGPMPDLRRFAPHQIVEEIEAAGLRGRGACQHPDGAVRFIASALQVFAADFDDHARNGPCERCARSSVLPAPVMAA